MDNIFDSQRGYQLKSKEKREIHKYRTSNKTKVLYSCLFNFKSIKLRLNSTFQNLTMKYNIINQR